MIPDKTILHVVWPEELFGIQESSVSVVLSDGTTCPFSECDIALRKVSTDRKSCNLDIMADDKRVVVRMELGEQFLEGARFEAQGAGPVLVRIGKKEFPLGEYLSSYPPLLLFSDGSELSGCLLYPVPDFTSVFPADQLVVKDWSNVDIQKESIRSGSESRKDSVQWRAYEICRAEAFDVIFNDDGSNEAADLVCVRDDDKHILVRLVHCKFSAETEPGARLEDAVVVASQATRCVRWNWNFEKLCDHLRNRETLALQKGRSSRLLVGSLKTLKQLRALSRYRDVVFEIVAAQPGISKDNLTEQQKMVLGSAEHFIRETVAVGLTIWCSN